MTIPRRADMASGDPRLAARAKLLAELPHVGDEPAAAPAASLGRTRKSTHPAFAEYVDQDELKVEPVHSRTTRYVDQAHIDDEWDHENFVREEEHRRPNQQFTHRYHQANHKPTAKFGLGGLLSQAHQQVAPFAGLIVTAALVAAAGLLFHMMVENNTPNAEVNEFALPGFQVKAFDEPLTHDDPAPLAEVSPTHTSSEPENVSIEPTELIPGEEVGLKAPPADVSAQCTPPLAEATTDSTILLGRLSFPLTDTPLALDYSRATDPDLQKLPEVAERTETAATEGINR